MQGTLSKKLVSFLLIALSGALIALYVSFCLTLKLKYSVVFLGALLLPFVALLFANRIQEFILFLFILVLPLNYGKMLGVSPPYEYHVGGAPVEGLELYLTDILLVGLLVVWFLKAANREISPPAILDRMDVVLFCMLLWFFASSFASDHPMMGVREIYRWFRYYLVFFYFSNSLRDRKHFKIVITLLLLGILLQAGLGFTQYMTSSFFDAYGRTEEDYMDRFKGLEADAFIFVDQGTFRASGTVGPLNVQAMYYGFVLPLALSFALMAQDRRIRFLAGVCFVLGTAATLLTFSRGGWINMILSSIVVIFFAVRKRYLSLKGLIMLFFFGLFIMIAFMALFPSITMQALDRFTHLGHEYSVGPRVVTMKAAFIMIRDHLFLGVGTNQFGETSRELIHVPKSILMYEKMPVHNRFLLIAAESGIPAMLLYIVFILFGLITTFRALVRTRDPFYSAICIGSLGAIVGTLWHMQIDIYDVYIINMLVMIVLAIPRAISRLDRFHDRPEPGTS